MPSLQTVKKFLSAARLFFGEVLTRCSLRVAVWVATVFISLLPTIIAADIQPDFDIYGMAHQINDKGLFKDLFYIIVIVALLGLSNMITDVVEKGKPNAFYKSMYILLGAAFFYFIIIGVVEFDKIASHQNSTVIVPERQFTYDLRIIFVTCILELFVELLLAFRRN